MDEAEALKRIEEGIKQLNHLHQLKYGGLRAILEQATRPSRVESLYDNMKRTKKEENHNDQ
jgi:uncharacterized pyridoxal phosphate-containing UPF0001 family protein